MDLTQLIEQLGKGGNTWIILIVAALFLFKDKIPFLKPATPATPVPTTPPIVTDPATPATPLAPAERPLVDAFIKLLPVIVPLLLKSAKEADAKAPAEPPK